VRVGYLQFKVKQYIPKPLRCFKCNRYGHVANYCKSKERCSNCGSAHNWKNCDYPNRRCPNCKGNQSAANTGCPLYNHELEIVKIKAVCNIAYAEACRKQHSTEKTNCTRPFLERRNSNTASWLWQRSSQSDNTAFKLQQDLFDHRPTNGMLHSSRKLFRIYFRKPIVVLKPFLLKSSIKL